MQSFSSKLVETKNGRDTHPIGSHCSYFSQKKIQEKVGQHIAADQDGRGSNFSLIGIWKFSSSRSFEKRISPAQNEEEAKWEAQALTDNFANALPSMPQAQPEEDEAEPR